MFTPPLPGPPEPVQVSGRLSVVVRVSNDSPLGAGTRGVGRRLVLRTGGRMFIAMGFHPTVFSGGTTGQRIVGATRRELPRCEKKVC